VRLHNGRTLLELDARAGAIIRIEDAISGVVCIDASQGEGKYARLFRVVTPTPQWTSRYADSQEQEPPEVARDAAGVTSTPIPCRAHQDPRMRAPVSEPTRSSPIP